MAEGHSRPSIPSPSAPLPTAAALSRLPEEWASEIEGMLASDRVPGAAITLFVNDRAYHHFYGETRAGAGRPIDASTGFQLCSLSKAYVATLCLALAAAGEIDIDAPVAPLVPELSFEPAWLNGEINLRDLLSNRLGLERGGLADYGLAQRHDYPELARRFSRMRRSTPFRTAYSYSNPAFSTAVLAIERATGRTFPTLLEERILGPAGLLQTSMGASARSDPHRARSHTVDRTGTLVEVDADDDWARPGGGGLMSSPGDQLGWIRLNLGRGTIDGRLVLPEAIWEELWRPHIFLLSEQRELWLGDSSTRLAAYALGWYVADYRGRLMVAHTGGGAGWRTRTILLPDEGLGLSVLLNVDGKTGTAIQHRLLERCLELPASPWQEVVRSARAAGIHRARAQLDEGFPPGPVPPLEARSAQGRYRNPESGIAIIGAKADELVIDFEDCADLGGPLLPLGGPVFEIAVTGPIATYDGPDAPLPRLQFKDCASGASGSFVHSSMGEFQRC